MLGPISHIDTTSVFNNNKSKQTTIPSKLFGTFWPPKEEIKKIEWQKCDEKIVVKPIKEIKEKEEKQ